MIGNHLEPFKFWCQKVLPNVYDDSLSYYEYLCKLNEYLNEVIGQINTLTDNMEDYEADLTATWLETKEYIDNYFNNLDVQQEINNKLDQMAQSGALSTLLAPIVGTQIGGVVAEQIGGTVANQIGDTVASQIGPVVASQIDEPTATATNAWLTAHVDPVGSAVIVDNSLTVSGAAADAKVVGDDVADLREILTYPYGAIDEISGIKSMPFCRDNWSLTDGTPITENPSYKFIDGLIKPTSTLFVRCTRPDLFNTFYLKYNKNGTYVNWRFIDTTFGNEWAYLDPNYHYRIAITRLNNTLPNPTLEDAKYLLLWEIKTEDYADLYKPQTYLTDRSLYRKHKENYDGEVELTWVRENRRLGDGTIIENPNNHNMITTLEFIDCSSESLFIVNDSVGDLFLIKYSSLGVYDSWVSASDLFNGKQYGWLTQGYKYYPLVTTGTLSEQFKIRVFNSKKNKIYVPNDMAKIQCACTFAKDYDTIYIANGTYLEDVSVYTKKVNFIGESRDYTIVKTTTDKYSQPPLEIAVGSVQNMTFISDDTDRSESEQEDHAYAVHIDYPQLIGYTLEFVNCKFLSKNNSSVGCGLRNNSTIQFINCEFICDNSYALFAHTQTNPEQTGSNQFIEVNNCVLESKTLNKCVSLMRTLGSDNNGTYTSYNCIYKANGNAPTDYDRKTYQETGGTFVIDDFSFGNNVAHMNGTKHN